MTSTSFNVGLNTGTRASSKVLKPPGGGSSDIFGSSGGEPIEPQRKIRNHLTSSIFGGETVTPSRNKPGNNSHNNLFESQPQTRKVSAFKDQFKSNITFQEPSPIADVNIAKKTLTSSSPENESLLKEGNSSNEILLENCVAVELIASTCSTNEQKKCNDKQGTTYSTPKSDCISGASSNSTDGNQTSAGDGSKGETPAVNGTSNSSSVASTPAATPAVPAAPTTAPSAGKQRVPPGGFSSGLW